jgi:methylenetetrahydrofolate reductase (NADPH)
MCGNCLLQETAFICPMLCPKGLRNGPCGSGASEACCVEPSRTCVWHLIYVRADAMSRLDELLEVQAPLDWSRVGRETWATVVSEARERGLLSPTRALRDTHWGENVAQVFKDIRQPDWWQGDDRYHPPASPQPVSQLQAALERGEFAITAEIAPPVGASASRVQGKTERLQGLVHAANVTENPMANPRMSSLACGLLLARYGIEPIVQLTARDYSRLALQSEVLGASALGIRNVLCLTGDPPTTSHGPGGRLPYDLDATQMLWVLRRLRDEGRFLDGREVNEPPELFLGAAGSPNDPDPRLEAVRLEKKVNAGAQYIQTQLVYDVDALQRWLEALDTRHLLGRVHILVGIGPLRSVKVARYMQEHIPDVFVPVRFIERMEQSPDPEQTGLEISLELIREVRALPGVSGVHIMSVGWERILPPLLREAGLAAQVRQQPELGNVRLYTSQPELRARNG